MKKEKNKTAGKHLVEMVFLLDRSGSMSGLEGDTIGGFNSMIQKQQKQEGDGYVSTVLFNHTSEVLHDRVKLSEVKKLTEGDYFAQGSTALLDAVGGAIRHIQTIHRYIREEDVPEYTMVTIITDGMENASRKYSSEDIKQMIEQEKEEHGWEFLFVGANMDAIEAAANIGIGRNRAVNYHADKRGTETVYEAMAKIPEYLRKAEPLMDTWSEEIEADYEMRKKQQRENTDAQNSNRRGRRPK